MEDLSVLLGRHDLTEEFEDGSVYRTVKDMWIHPEWRILSDKYDADLAVLVLSEPVEFSQYVQPVCLPQDLSVNSKIEGTVVRSIVTDFEVCFS